MRPNSLLRVDFIPISDRRILGRLGVCAAPGIGTAESPRSLFADLEQLRFQQKANTLISLLRPSEIASGGVGDLPTAARIYGLEVEGFSAWQDGRPLEPKVVQKLAVTAISRLRAGQTVVVHGRGRRGRGALFAACVLAALGFTKEEAIRLVRASCDGGLETSESRLFLENFITGFNPVGVHGLAQGLSGSLLDRYAGTLFGLVLGDIYGASNAIQRQHLIEERDSGKHGSLKNAFSWTVISGLTVAVGSSLVETGKIDPEDLFQRFIALYSGGQYSRSGEDPQFVRTLAKAATRKASDQFIGEEAQQPSPGIYSRLAPLALAYAWSPYALLRLVPHWVRFTDGLREVVESGQLLANIMTGILRGDSKATVLSADYVAADYNTSAPPPILEFAEPAVIALQSGGYKEQAPPRAAQDTTTGNLGAALHTFCHYEELLEGLTFLSSQGCGSSTMAIYGQLHGAYYGIAGLPEGIVSRIPHSNLLSHLARDLVDLRFSLTDTLSEPTSRMFGWDPYFIGARPLNAVKLGSARFPEALDSNAGKTISLPFTYDFHEAFFLERGRVADWDERWHIVFIDDKLIITRGEKYFELRGFRHSQGMTFTELTPFGEAKEWSPSQCVHVASAILDIALGRPQVLPFFPSM